METVDRPLARVPQQLHHSEVQSRRRSIERFRNFGRHKLRFGQQQREPYWGRKWTAVVGLVGAEDDLRV
jgi:hypothetical protein